jgi:PKD repeat protein/subtilisin-like proprotein convertase family protein
MFTFSTMLKFHFYRVCVAMLLCCGWALVGQAQTFTATPALPILDNTDTCTTVNVAGLAAPLSMVYGIEQVCIDATHSYINDIGIRIISPNNTDTVVLMNNIGGDGDNLVGTCFRQNGAAGLINNGAAPLTGNFIPMVSLNTFNTGITGNGLWQVCVIDNAPPDTGTLSLIALAFGPNPPATIVPALPCGVANPAGCKCPDSTAVNCDLLPDMTNSALCIQQSINEDPGSLDFGTATPNIGWGPMEIHGTDSCYCDTTPWPCATPCPAGQELNERIFQTVYHRADSAMTTWTHLGGTMTYHPTHGHTHVNRWVENTLRIMGPDPDPRTWPIVSLGTKVSFCLINLSDCDFDPGFCIDDAGQTLMGANLPNDNFGTVSGCGRDQGIYVGSLDIYSNSLNEPVLLDSNFCNGKYYFVSVTDPNNDFVESNEDNNASVVELHLGQQGGGVCCAANFYADTLWGYAPFTVQFADSSLPVPDTLTWAFGDGGSSTQHFPQHTYTTPGLFTVNMSIGNDLGCAANHTRTAYIQVLADTTTNNIADPILRDLSLFPNPTTGAATLSYRQHQRGQVAVSVQDVAGRTIFNMPTSVQAAGQNTLSIPAEAFVHGAGIYLVRVQHGGSVQTLKLVRQ